MATGLQPGERPLMHLVCIDSETLELRRYEFNRHAKKKMLQITHSGHFRPSGDEKNERQAVELVRKYPAHFDLPAVPEDFEPEDYLWQAPNIPEGY